MVYVAYVALTCYLRTADVTVASRVLAQILLMVLLSGVVVVQRFALDHDGVSVSLL